MIIPEDQEVILKSFQGAQRGEFLDYEVRFISRFGDILTLEIKSIPQIVNDKVVGYIGIAREITQQKKIEAELDRNQEEASKTKARLEYLIASNPVIIYACEPRERLWTSFISSNVTAITGYEIDDFFSKKTPPFGQEIVHPDDRRRIADSFNQILEKKYFKEIYRLQIKNGTYRWFLEEAKLIYDSNNEPLEIIGFLLDISDQKKAEEELKASEQQYRTIIDALADPIHIIDRDLKVLIANEAFQKLFQNYDLDNNIIGKKLSKAFPFLPKEAAEDFKRIFATKKAPPPTFKSALIDGVEYISEIRKVPIFQNGEVKQILTIVREMTEKKKMEDQLKRSEKKYRNLISNLSDVVVEIDSKGNFTFISPQAKSTFGYSPEKSINTSIYDYIHHNDLEKVKENINRALQGQYVLDFEYRIKHNDGNYILVSSSGRLIDEVQNKKIVAVIRDISKQRALERELINREQRYTAFINAATYSFALWDSNLNLIDINKNGLMFISRLMGKEFIKKDEVIGWNLIDFVNLEKKEEEEVLKYYKKVLETGEGIITEIKPRGIKFNDLVISIRAFKVNDSMMGLITTDISDQKKIENELREKEELFRSIFDNAPIGMALVNLNYNFTRVNTTLCKMLGYSNDELTQMSFAGIYELTDPGINILEIVLKNDSKIYNFEKRLLTKAKEQFWTNTTITLLKDEFQNPISYLLMIEDIHELKKREEEMKKKSFKFKIEDGNLYLINESSPILSKTVFEDLQKFGYKGYIISRSHISEFNKHFKEKFEFFGLLGQDSDSILKFINEKSNSVFLIDRIDYLFNTEGYDIIIKFIFKLREIAFYNNLVVIISIDSATLRERELRILEKETHPIEPRSLATIPEHYLEILRLVYQQNNLGVKPTYTEIKNSLKVSRPTLRKRIKILVSTGYLYENIKGKSKVLEISERGRSLFTI